MADRLGGEGHRTFSLNSLIMAKEGADNLEEKGRQERLKAIEE